MESLLVHGWAELGAADSIECNKQYATKYRIYTYCKQYLWRPTV
jgi:hypothetical protein